MVFISDYGGLHSTTLLVVKYKAASSATEAQVGMLVASPMRCDTWHSPTWGPRACGVSSESFYGYCIVDLYFSVK